MSKDFSNKKFSEDPVDAKVSEPEYPWVSGYSDRNGKFEITYADPKKQDTSFSQKFNYDGSGEQQVTVADSSIEGVTATSFNNKRSMTVHGSSGHTIGQEETSGDATFKSSRGMQVALDVGQNGIQVGTSGAKIEVAGQGSVSQSAVGSDSDDYQYTSGDRTTRHDGNQYHHNDGDFMSTTGGTKYEVVKDGEFGLHVQSGNWDTQVDAGKGRVFVQDELLIESPTKITFKVGGSTIVMEPSKITLISDRIDLNP